MLRWAQQLHNDYFHIPNLSEFKNPYVYFRLRKLEIFVWPKLCSGTFIFFRGNFQILEEMNVKFYFLFINLNETSIIGILIV